jgi:hypothetical protein
MAKLKKIKGLKKILKKPSVKPIKGISAEKTLKSFAHSTGPVVKEVPKREIQEDTRSLYFKEEYAREKIGEAKWLG